jgi:hypothetical protein
MTIDPIPIILNIAGEEFEVLFDGKRVTSPVFPDQLIDYTAVCGTRIAQRDLVEICDRKRQTYAKRYLQMVDEHPCTCIYGHPGCAPHDNGYCSDEMLSKFGLDNDCVPYETSINQ